jgi:hypothetical protein
LQDNAIHSEMGGVIYRFREGLNLVCIMQ